MYGGLCNESAARFALAEHLIKVSIEYSVWGRSLPPNVHVYAACGIRQPQFQIKAIKILCVEENHKLIDRCYNIKGQA